MYLKERSEVKQLSFISKVAKRSIDILGALIGLCILIPTSLIFLFIYSIGQNKGPMFFKQIRLGQDGKEFYIYKFRSMVVNAEEKLKRDKVLYHKYLKNNYKLEQHEDPRITKFGQFIRKTSLDELPQFVNILKGEMSLVGPRPIVKEELKEYGFRKRDFLAVKPGLTGYWQVCGRSDIGYPERVDIELFYVYKQSLLLDITILFKTIIHVLLRRGAY
ncbi:sugar transferase [Bacillus sp. DTU_2020_1000418_1_SI_GHA_SEK_038]|uniref:sugar transferase n=1 Tax=Bacillus sp. DTU_2020_1000418_1_SI_GHA_SEK_038 TaxID=3077585 RepID=UPI0028EA82DF|nr:sugar transferase [Bacillus sp. DTU_2020_1000418_1_SI_GHA_SEK_038]WNS77668.1 sugar transferase [Bacillus sp. DTU_2020_1000418_1_SI_GHA_SEK_038]